MDDINIEEYFDTLPTPTPRQELLLPTKDEMDRIKENNFALIECCNDLIKDRIDNGDSSLSLKDLVSASDTAFKQNQLIM